MRGTNFERFAKRIDFGNLRLKRAQGFDFFRFELGIPFHASMVGFHGCDFRHGFGNIKARNFFGVGHPCKQGVFGDDLPRRDKQLAEETWAANANRGEVCWLDDGRRGNCVANGNAEHSNENEGDDRGANGWFAAWQGMEGYLSQRREAHADEIDGGKDDPHTLEQNDGTNADAESE